MPTPGHPNWPAIRTRAELFPEPAFDFVREGLAHTSKSVFGDDPGAAQPSEDSRHVSGQQLCIGLRDLALKKYGLLAPTVLRRWGIRRTDDFGVIVYAMIDRQEMRCSDEDRFDDFVGVFEFEEAFSPEHACGLA